jgi:phage repressor protein C with HTH and peptisase S24 domain
MRTCQAFCEKILIIFRVLRGFVDLAVNQRIAEIRQEKRLNKKELADLMGIPSSIISDIENEKREPSKEFLHRFSQLHNISLNWLFYGVGSKSLAIAISNFPIYSQSDIENMENAFVIPLLDQKLSAGSGQELPTADEVSALIPVPASLVKYGKNLAALTVEGDSMYPTLERGDLVVCDSCGWSGEGIYAMRMGGDGFVKRITKAPGKIVIISDNPKYPIREEPEGSQDFDIIGRVHYAIKNME